jgi:predicted ATPase
MPAYLNNDRVKLPMASNSSTNLFVGRDRERAQLRDLLNAAIAGHGSLVLISGEAGIGKTTLVDDLAQQAEDGGVLVLSGGCYDLTTTPPYGPWGELLRDYPTAVNTLPNLPDQLRQGGDMAGIASQFELFHLAHNFFAEVSTHRPLLLVLEDLHWSDPASLELLRYLGRTIGQEAIMLIASYRHEEIVRSHTLYALLPLIVRESHAQRIHLTRLDRDTVREMIEREYALPDGDTGRLVEYVWQRAEGNPFFVDELLQGLKAERVLQPSEDGWRLGDLDTAHLPPLLLQVLDSRLDHLSLGTQRALQIAAVIGQEVPLELWQTIGQMENASLDQAIVEAIEAHVLEQFGKMAGLRFRHALLREALYESIIISCRRTLHRQVGDLLAATSSPDLDAVAHHFQQAGDDRAVYWFIQAGERAIRLYSWNIAIARFETALELLETIGTDLEQQGWLHYRIGRHLRFSDPEQSVRHLERAERLATAANERVLAAFALSDRGMIRFFGGTWRRGLEEMLAGDRALEALETDGVAVDDAVLACQPIRRTRGSARESGRGASIFAGASWQVCLLRRVDFMRRSRSPNLMRRGWRS